MFAPLLLLLQLQSIALSSLFILQLSQQLLSIALLVVHHIFTMSTSTSVKDLLTTIKTVEKSKISESERQDLLAASAELQVKVENPWDTVFRLVFIAVSLTPAVSCTLPQLSNSSAACARR